jgi:hypothetical protein
LAYFRRVTPPIHQSREWTCWAAALSWWTGVVRGRTPQTEADLIAAYATDPATGALDATTGWPPLASDLGLSYEVRTGTAVNPAWIEGHLRADGYVVLVYRRGADDSHAVVVYGVSDQFVNVMDPEYGRYRWFTGEWLASVPYILVAWPNW